MVILRFLGVLEKIDALSISQGNKIKLLSDLLDTHPKNIETDFNGRAEKIDSPLSNKSNYEFLVKLFTELGLKKEVEKAEIMLEKITNKKG